MNENHEHAIRSTAALHRLSAKNWQWQLQLHLQRNQAQASRELQRNGNKTRSGFRNSEDESASKAKNKTMKNVINELKQKDSKTKLTALPAFPIAILPLPSHCTVVESNLKNKGYTTDRKHARRTN